MHQISWQWIRTTETAAAPAGDSLVVMAEVVAEAKFAGTTFAPAQLQARDSRLQIATRSGGEWSSFVVEARAGTTFFPAGARRHNLFPAGARRHVYGVWTMHHGAGICLSMFFSSFAMLDRLFHWQQCAFPQQVRWHPVSVRVPADDAGAGRRPTQGRLLSVTADASAFPWGGSLILWRHGFWCRRFSTTYSIGFLLLWRLLYDVQG